VSLSKSAVSICCVPFSVVTHSVTEADLVRVLVYLLTFVHVFLEMKTWNSLVDS